MTCAICGKECWMMRITLDGFICLDCSGDMDEEGDEDEE